MWHLIFWGSTALLALFWSWFIRSPRMMARLHAREAGEVAAFVRQERTRKHGAMSVVLGLVALIWAVQLMADRDVRAAGYAVVAVVFFGAAALRRRAATRLVRELGDPEVLSEPALTRRHARARRWAVSSGALYIPHVLLQAALGPVEDMPTWAQLVTVPLVLAAFAAAIVAFCLWFLIPSNETV